MTVPGDAVSISENSFFPAFQTQKARVMEGQRVEILYLREEKREKIGFFTLLSSFV